MMSYTLINASTGNKHSGSRSYIISKLREEVCEECLEKYNYDMLHNINFDIDTLSVLLLTDCGTGFGLLVEPACENSFELN